MDRDLDPLIGEWWVGPACVWGTSEACVLGYPTKLHWFANRHVIRYDLSTILHRSKNWNMKGGVTDLFAQLLLESRTGAYIEWLDNKLIWLLIITAIRTHY